MPLQNVNFLRWNSEIAIQWISFLAALKTLMSVCPSHFLGHCLLEFSLKFQEICRKHSHCGRKFDMLKYLFHLHNWLDFGHHLLISLILMAFWLSETGQIWGFGAFSGETMEGLAWNNMLMYPDNLQNWLDFCSDVLIFFYFWCILT